MANECHHHTNQIIRWCGEWYGNDKSLATLVGLVVGLVFGLFNISENFMTQREAREYKIKH